MGLTGCLRVNLISDLPGRYEGLVIQTQPEKTTQLLVTGEVRLAGAHALELRATTLREDRGWDFRLDVEPKRPPVLTVGGAGTSIPLTDQSRTCFSSERKAGSSLFRLCHRDGHLTVEEQRADTTSWVLSVDVVQQGAVPKPESPASYTAASLVQRAMDQSFASRIEFEHVLQAKYGAQIATANLLPHAGINTILGFLSFSVSTIYRSVGDLAPFLIPSRWLKAQQARLRAEGELQAWLAMKADAGNIAEGLLYAHARELESVRILLESVPAIVAIRDRVVLAEQLGLLPKDSSDELTLVLNAIEKSRLALEEAARAERRALAQAVGFVSPEAISGVEAVPDAVEIPGELMDPPLFARLVLERSVELRQLNSLIAAARTGSKQKYFDWLDPAGDPSGALGGGFYSNLLVGRSQVREMLEKREQLRSVLLQKVSSSIGELKLCSEEERLARENLAIQETRVQRLADTVQLGGAVAVTQLAGSLQERVRARLELVATRYARLVTVSRANRLLFAGPYAAVLEITAP